jgi:hypothetical protein
MMDPIKLVSVIAAALTRVTFGTLTAPFAFFFICIDRCRSFLAHAGGPRVSNPSVVDCELCRVLPNIPRHLLAEVRRPLTAGRSRTTGRPPVISDAWFRVGTGAFSPAFFFLCPQHRAKKKCRCGRLLVDACLPAARPIGSPARLWMESHVGQGTECGVWTRIGSKARSCSRMHTHGPFLLSDEHSSRAGRRMSRIAVSQRRQRHCPTGFICITEFASQIRRIIKSTRLVSRT